MFFVMIVCVCCFSSFMFVWLYVCIWYVSWLFCVGVLGGVLSHVSIFSAMTVFAYGHDVALPCFMTHSKFTFVVPCLVIIVTGTLYMVSSSHST